MNTTLCIRPLAVPSGRARAAAAASLALLLGACASTPVAPLELAAAETAVQRANTADTAAHAPAELRVATDKLAAARAAVTAGDTDRARTLSEQVAIDARVAELHADAVRSARAAKETQDAARALSEEIQRKPNH
jgi:ABC-type amino acid transport substrate-binding protein